MTHLDLDALADLLAAEGTPDAEAHVASCAGCAGRLDELAAAEVEVAAVLAALPAPPLPAGLAERLQAAVDAEPALVPAPSDEGPVALGTGARAVGAGRSRTGSATVTPFPGAGRRAPRAWLPAAAAVAVLAVGGAVVVPALSGGSSDDAATSAAGSAADSSASSDGLGDLTRSETGTDYAADGTLAAALPALLGGSAGAVVAPLAETGDAEQPAPGPASGSAPESAPESAAEAAPGPGDLGAVEAPAPALGGSGSAARDAGPDPALDRLRTPAGLASCLSALLPAEEPDLRPLAVDYAAYAGEPALVVVLPATGGAPKVDVFVVGAGCTAGDDRTLFFTRLDRP